MSGPFKARMVTITVRMTSGREYNVCAGTNYNVMELMRKIRKGGERWFETREGPVLLNLRNMESITIADGDRRLKEGDL